MFYKHHRKLPGRDPSFLSAILSQAGDYSWFGVRLVPGFYRNYNITVARDPWSPPIHGEEKGGWHIPWIGDPVYLYGRLRSLVDLVTHLLEENPRGRMKNSRVGLVKIAWERGTGNYREVWNKQVRTIIYSFSSPRPTPTGGFSTSYLTESTSTCNGPWTGIIDGSHATWLKDETTKHSAALKLKSSSCVFINSEAGWEPVQVL